MASELRASTVAYFDCNATTPTLPIAADAALEAMRTLYGNPSSSHLVGLQAKSILEGARKVTAEVLGVQPDCLVFTSGATEAIQTVIFSVLVTAKEHGLGSCDRVLYSATEHKAVSQALKHWVKVLDLPLQIVAMPVDSQGQLRQDVLRRELPQALLLCTMAVNNETGVIQNLALVEQALKETGSRARWLVDGVQALGKVELGLARSRVDYVTFSGHKLYAPKGIGLLYIRSEAPIIPLIVGGGQERGLRSGTENLPGVAAFGAILRELLKPEGESVFASTRVLCAYRDQIVAELRRSFPKIEFNTPFECSVPTTLNFSVPDLSNRELLDLFDSAGVRLSSGSACSSTSVEPSEVLDAMGIPEWRSVSALRLSFGPCTDQAEIDRGCRAIREAALALRSSCLLNTAGGFEAPAGLRDGVIQIRTGATNTWIIADKNARTCVVIDPSESAAERIESYIRCQDLAVVAVLDTHSHADHDSTRPFLQRILEDLLVSGASHGADALGWPSAGGWEVELDSGLKVSALRLGVVPGGERILARLPTPGHTSDSHAFLLGVAQKGKLEAAAVQFVFCGDTILSGGLGRTNFTVSEPSALFHSLRLLAGVLAPRTLLCPAHDYDNSFATTLETESRENALLKSVFGRNLSSALGRFVEEKKSIDLRLASLEEDFQGIVCGVAGARGLPGDAEMKISPAQLRAAKEEYRVIDVREPQEHVLFKDWSALGLRSPARNVPLSRFVNFMREILSGEMGDARIVLLCRSGNRSLQAAKTLRRMGYPQVWSLEGGVTLL